MKTKKKGTTIGLAEKLGYAGISVADNLRGSYRGTFMQFFCTNVLMIRPGILATLMSLVTIWDAINDPLIASYADNHPNKNGDRARQYLWAGIPLSIIMILMFVRFSMNPTISLMIIFCLNILFSVATTFHRLPFYAMMILVSPHEADRLSVNKFHFFGTAIGTALGSLAMWPLVRLVGGVDEAGNVANPEKGFLMGMVVVGAIVIILSLYHYYTTKERVHPQQTEKTPMIEAIKILFKKAVFRRNVILDFLRSTIIAATTGYALYLRDLRPWKTGLPDAHVRDLPDLQHSCAAFPEQSDREAWKEDVSYCLCRAFDRWRDHFHRFREKHHRRYLAGACYRSGDGHD